MKENQPVVPNSAGKSQDNLHQPSLSQRITSTRVVIITILGVLVIVFFVLTGYWIYQNNQLKSQALDDSSSASISPIFSAPPPVKQKQESTITPLSRSRPNTILTEWKTYEDPKIGFRFNNPNNYVLNLGLEYHEPSRSKIILLEPSVYKQFEKEGIGGVTSGIYISVYEGTKEIPLMDKAKEIVYDSNFGIDNGTYELKLIQGVDTVKHSNGENVSYYLYADDHLLIFANLGASLQEFEELISTLYLP